MATLDREVRLTPNQMVHLDRLVRNRVSELGRKISRAEESRSAGNTIQLGTLQHHYEELGELAQVREALEVARRQIQPPDQGGPRRAPDGGVMTAQERQAIREQINVHARKQVSRAWHDGDGRQDRVPAPSDWPVQRTAPRSVFAGLYAYNGGPCE